jgi:AraC-like DNA-binding protein
VTITSETDDRRRSERGGTDRELAARLYEDLYGATDVRFGGDGEFRFRHRTLHDLHVDLVSSAVTTDRHAVMTADRWLTLGWTNAGGVQIDVAGARDVTRPGVPVVFPTTGSFTVDTPPGVHHLVRIDLSFVETVDAVLHGTRTGPSVFRRHPTPERIADLRTSLGAVATAAFDDDESPRRRFSLQVRLAESVVRAFGSQCDADDRGAGLTTVGLAQAYLAEHCCGMVSLRDICDAAGVSPRTLQSSFLRHTGSTPMAYLQEMRLDRVRIALQFADPKTVTVGAVAREWGFRHMGRFAGSYLQRFREYPGETLRGVPARRLRVLTERRTA